MEEDRTTIATCKSLPSTWSSVADSHVGIKRTKLRLVRCRARMTMTDRQRMEDARLDKNLDDIARFPAPWDMGNPENQPPPNPPVA